MTSIVDARVEGSWLSSWQSEDVDLALSTGGYRRVAWGRPWQFGTAAYWVELTKERLSGSDGGRSHRLADSMTGEVVACLLGGYGVTFELNVAAYDAVRRAGVLDDDVADLEGKLVAVLSSPLRMGERFVRYRYPNQRAARVASALKRLRKESAPTSSHDAREWLLTFSGIGPKTASWIVRNQFHESNVAIIDIHVTRAGVRAGVFDRDWTPQRDYWLMEKVFLGWAEHGGVTAADLDAVIWREQALASRRSAKGR